MGKKVILLNDTTSHGGVVISGSPVAKVRGRPVARLGDQVDCPQTYPGGKPHGVNKIIEGDSKVTLHGIPVALEGHHTECGCVLIASEGFSVGG